MSNLKSEILQLYKEGLSYENICKKLSCAKSTVSYHCNLLNKGKNRFIKDPFKLNCKNCLKEIVIINSRKKENGNFCSRSCACIFNNKINASTLSIAGKISAEIQGRRSLNEIYFQNLCIDHFNNVDINKRIFNGWDADVIIHDMNIAVLRNGKWHYEKIKKNHDVSKVVKRDLEKISQIIKCGYYPFIIKDMGKRNDDFVNSKFSELIRNLSKYEYKLD